MANPGQPTISLGAIGDAVKRLERALRRTPNPGLAVDGVFGPQVETAVKQVQQGAGQTVDGIVGPATWAALPDGGPMPTLQEGSTGAVVSSLQTLLTNGAAGQWTTTPQGIDGNFGPRTKVSVVAFQAWGAVAQDGIVGDQTWAVSLHAASAILETGAYRCWSVEPKRKMGVHNYEGDGCYDALGTACHEAGEDSAALRLIKSMDLPSLTFA